MPDFQDRQIKCADCGQDFTFTAGEQEFFARKGFQQEPKRCKPCRDVRRSQRGAAPERDSAAPSAEPRSRASGGREMFDATCGRCGGPARVPFAPTPGRSVYCRSCYGGGAGRSG